jgi:hypothetical protein
MENASKRLEDHALYAWVGEDELGSGRIGLKQGLVPAGYIPLVAMDYDRHKIDRAPLRTAMETQARKYGKKIRLVKFVFAEVVAETTAGQ